MKEDSEPTRFIRYLDITRRHLLSYDSNQWIIQRRTGGSWKPLAYIGSASENLMKVVHWKRIPLTKDAKDFIESLPPFLEWIKTIDEATPLRNAA